MPAPPNYVFTIFSFVAFFLCLIKFPTQFHAWNVGTHLFLGWIGLECLFKGINSIIWNQNTVNCAPVWCDITTRFNVGISIAFPAAILCINRRLYLLASPTSLIPTQADKNRELIIDLIIGIGLPIIVMVLSFLVQSARFMITEDYGCSMPNLNTWATVVIVSIPPILLELIAGVYGCLSIHAFYNRSKLNDTRNNNNNNLDSKRYIKLICFSAYDLLTGIPITLFYLYINIKAFVSTPDLTQQYFNFSKILQLPAIIWRADTVIELCFELNRWITVWAAFVFFAIFGFTVESRNNYRAMLQPVIQVFVKVTGFKSRPSSKSEGIIFNNNSESDSYFSSTKF